jgi:pimeloyl-ACP methyl ester carboxylesterase
MTSAADLTHLHHLVHLPSRNTALISYPSSERVRRPVLFIHGVHSSPGHLDHWRHRCEEAGFSPYCFSYPTKGFTNDVASSLAAIVTEIHTSHAAGVALVGHSLGGVLAAAATVELTSNRSAAVSHVVAVCSPFGGATLAKAAFLGPSRHLLHDLCHGSEFLDSLNTRLAAVQTGVSWTSIGLQHDGVVSDASATLHHPDASHVTLNGENHLSALISSPVADCIVSSIAT